MKLESLNMPKFEKNQLDRETLKNITGGEIHRQYDSYSGNGTCVDHTTLQCTGNTYDQDSTNKGASNDHIEFPKQPSHWDKPQMTVGKLS